MYESMAHNYVGKNEGSLMAFIEVRSSKAILARGLVAPMSPLDPPLFWENTRLEVNTP